MRELLIGIALAASAACTTGVPKPVLQTATTSMATQLQLATAGLELCAADGDDRQAGCDRARQSLQMASTTNSDLQAQAQ